MCMIISWVTLFLCLITLILTYVRYEMHVTLWMEHFHSLQPVGSQNFWVGFKNVPLTFWSVQGICVISSVIGKPIAFAKSPWLKTQWMEYVLEGQVLVEIGPYCSKPSVIMVHLPGQYNKYMSIVLVTYLSQDKLCCMCLSCGHKSALRLMLNKMTIMWAAYSHLVMNISRLVR